MYILECVGVYGKSTCIWSFLFVGEFKFTLHTRSVLRSANQRSVGSRTSYGESTTMKTLHVSYDPSKSHSNQRPNSPDRQ